MALKVFADTNIFIDFIEQRPFELADNNKIFESAENNEIGIVISESVVTNSLYITGLHAQFIKLLHITKVRCIDTGILKSVMKSSFRDKEDGILYYGAFGGKADYFITRNKKDFFNHSFAQLPVISPGEIINKITSK